MTTTCMNQSINPAIVGMFMYVQVFYALLFDIFVFDSAFMPLQLVGGAIVLAFAFVATIDKKREADKKKAEEQESLKLAAGDNSQNDDFKRV